MDKKAAQQLIKTINKGDPLPALPEIDHPEVYQRFQGDTKTQLGTRRGIVIGLTMAFDLDEESSSTSKSTKKGGNSS